MFLKKILDWATAKSEASKKSSKKQSMILPLSLVVALLLFYLFLVQPLMSRLGSIDQEIVNAKVQYEKFARLFANREEYTKQFREYQDYVTQKQKDEEEVAQFLKQIEQIAGELRVTDIKPQPVEKQGSLKRFYVQLQMEADTESVMHFMYQIGTVKELLRVEKYTLTQKDRYSGVLTASFVISKMLVEG